MPRRALTAASVERLKPPPKGQVEHFDKGFPGLALRLSYGGGKSWVYFYRVGKGGRLRRMTLGTYPALGLADAREAWRKAHLEVQLGRDPATARQRKTGATDFKTVAKEWLERDQGKNKSKAIVWRNIERDVLPTWQYRQISEIGRRDVLDVVDAIVDRGAVITARRVHANLHRLFAWAVGRGIVEINPLANLPRPGQETPRQRALTDDELLAVWRAAEKLGWPFGNAVQLLILTAARKSEISELRWSEINSAEVRLDGDRTKNGQPHIIALSAPARAIIEALPHVAGTDFVFTIEGRKPISGWSRAKGNLDKLASIEPWRLHDVRRTVATGLQKLGMPLQVTEAVLGHTSGSRAEIVGVYQVHDYADEKRAALEAWGAHVMALAEGRKPGKVLFYLQTRLK